MKRLSILLVGLLSIGIIFSVVGMADEADKASAVLTFTDVLDLYISDDSLSDTTIVQRNAGENEVALRDLSDGTIDLGSLDVTITSLTSFNVGVSYYADGEEDPDPAGLVNLSGDGTHVGIEYFDSSSILGDEDGLDEIGTSPTLGNLTDITSDFGTSGETSNVGDGGETKSYDVSIDLSHLENEYTDTDSITFDVAFWAFDAST